MKCISVRNCCLEAWFNDTFCGFKYCATDVRPFRLNKYGRSYGNCQYAYRKP